MDKNICNRLTMLLTAFLILTMGWSADAEARRITDMTGRQVTVPDKIRTVYATSPPATYMVYAMDPGLVAGLNFPLSDPDKKFLDPRMAKRPVIGGWYGQGRTGNLETLLQVQPDIVLVLKWQPSAINEKIEQMLKPLGIPVVYLTMAELADYPAAFHFLGELFNLGQRARSLAGYAEQTLAQAADLRADIAPDNQVSVYYAESAAGLSTECHMSIHAELIPLSGGVNVHRCSDRTTYGMQKISMEQVMQYDPQVIVFHEPLFRDHLADDHRWKNIRAVREDRVYRIPRTPFNWFDRPPSFMRLLGLKWMMHHLYPQAATEDLVAETRHFYRLFLNVNVDEPNARKLLKP